MSDSLESYGSCKPNISAAGRRRRRQVGQAAIAVTVLTFAIFIALRLPWTTRLLVGLPAAMAAVSLLQVRRNTCVARAREGTFEADDFSTTPMGAADVTKSRSVATGILRDSVVVGLAAAALGAASTLVA